MHEQKLKRRQNKEHKSPEYKQLLERKQVITKQLEEQQNRRKEEGEPICVWDLEILLRKEL